MGLFSIPQVSQVSHAYISQSGVGYECGTIGTAGTRACRLRCTPHLLYCVQLQDG
jgi:hypothetical protein